MDRYWLLTNTCYGNWLPGDERGFVGHVRDHRDEESEEDGRIVHSHVGSEYDADLSGLEAASREIMSGPPIHLSIEQADVALAQFLETARFRKWEILAASIMFNHFHLVVGVTGDPEPGKILGDFNSWGTRALTRRFGAPASETWWTEKGSKRKLQNAARVATACNYVLFKQPKPLAMWPASGAA